MADGYSRSGHWQDWVNLALGGWLFVSPWVLGYAGTEVAGWNSWSVGLCIVIVASVAAASGSRAAEGIALVLGLWLVISPWVLQIAAVPEPVYWNKAVVGLLVAIFAGWDLIAHRSRRVTG